MMRRLQNLIERQISRARLRSDLEELAGEGKLLPSHPEDAVVDPAHAAGFRIMAKAGVVPEEITLKKQLVEARAYLAELTGEADRKAQMERVANLELHYNIAGAARKTFMQRQGVAVV